MDETEATDISNEMPVRHQFVKMVLASVAGFFAHKLVEMAYDSYYVSHYVQNLENQK